MGNFYANITLRTPDIDTVVSVLDDLRRTAYVGTDGKSTVVFDEECDNQDLNVLQHLATQLSTRLDCVALAVCNHDDDVLWYALVAAGTLVDSYDSNPEYFGTGREGPRGGDADKLCAAFDVPQESAAVAAVLRRPPREVGFEVNRHEALREHLGLPQLLSILGFGYVASGDLDDDPLASSIRVVGNAEAPSDVPPAAAPPTPEVAKLRQEMSEKTLLAIQREAQDSVWETFALAREAEVPERFVPLFGVRRGTGHGLSALLTQYIMRNHLNIGGGWIRADDLLAEFLGEREFVIVALARLLRNALGIPPLTPEERAAFQRGDMAMMQRLMAALAAAQSDPSKNQQ